MKIGIDLGGSHIAIGVVDDNGIIIEKTEKRILGNDKNNIESFIESYIIEKVNKLKEIYEITNIGIAVPGTIKDNIIIKSVNLGVENYNLVEQLKKEIDIPISIRNDAKCAALAENKYGILKNYNRVLFLTLGTGIGGAVIIDGKLLNTGDLPGCEFGHMIIEKDGIECNCGKKGCFERYASMKAFKNKLRKDLRVDDTTRGQELLDMIKMNPQDEILKRNVDEFIKNLSIGISNLINIFEPEAIGIGGSFVYFEEIFLNKLKNEILNNNYLFNKREELIIVSASLGNDAGIIGAGI